MGKKIPKKRKWGKTNVDDVEDALEDEKAIQRMKQKNKDFRGKPNETDEFDGLFTVDTKGTFEGISKSSRRQLARAKLFPPKGPNIGLSWTEEAKVDRAARQVEARERPAAPKAPEVFDLWGAPPPKAQRNAASSEHSRVRKSAKPLYENVKMPGTLHQKVGLAPAVIPAHEGQSMNPHRDAYEDLACRAAAAEIEREHDVEELERKMRPMTHELRDLVGEEKLREMSEEEKLRLYRQFHLKREAAAREGEDDGEGFTRQRRKQKQKSQSFKNKKKRMANVDSIEEQAKAQRRLDKSVGEVGSMLKNMQEEATWHKSRKQYRLEMRAKRRELEVTDGIVPKKRKIGGGKFAEEAAIVPDAEALGGSLRATPLRASAVRDRLTSVVRRGLLPPPSEATKEKSNWHKKKNNKLKRGKKFISPLLKDNLLLR